MKPILFNTENIRAILNDQKTATRRVIKPQPRPHQSIVKDGDTFRYCGAGECKPPYLSGDILYVRETWKPYAASSTGRCVIEYKAGGKVQFDEIIAIPKYHGPWRPSIHMPRKAARIFLRVTGARAERLQDMRMGDMQAEGMIPLSVKGGNWYQWQCEYAKPIWNNTIKKKERNIYGWKANPWVWVIEFERISREEATSEEITL